MMAALLTQPFDAMQVSRPDKSLLKYYAIISLFAGPAYPLAFVPLFFRYQTLKYRFDREGVSMSWGILFRRETYLTYRRIQDIHLTGNILQRWMGLATVSVQTASGSSTPEMSIEGILQANQLRDFLYAQMRGARHESEPDHETAPAATVAMSSVNGQSDEALSLLREIRDVLKQAAVQRRGS
jgi:uncharacterized membrane protein YdbT with pleckstrin-like domain